MKAHIEDAVSIAEKKVRDEFFNEFNNIYTGNVILNEFDTKLKILTTKLEKPDDINGILSGAGFYLIVTDYEVSDNKCKLVFGDDLKAIYRGECVTAKKRVQSHLFNSIYKKEYEQRKRSYMAKPCNEGKEFYEQFWPACLKLGNGTNGIDINEEPYSENKWYIVVHNMIGSSQQVRVQAELAFDDAFNKPAASRENT